MYKKDVIDHFGTQRAAKALGISDAAVSQWKEVIPEKDAYRLEVVTAGALKSRKCLSQSGISKLLFNSHGPYSRRNAEYNAHQLVRITSYLL